jgi:hypothetical protein
VNGNSSGSCRTVDFETSSVYTYANVAEGYKVA